MNCSAEVDKLQQFVFQYISGRFSNGYRATIGADFITKTLPHPIHEDQSVMLQIWVSISSYSSLFELIETRLGYSRARTLF